MLSPWIIGAVFLVVALIAVPLLPPVRKWRKNRHQETAVEKFRIQREQLEAKFVELARRRGKPRGLYWKNCDWQGQTTFGTDRETGLVTAFASVYISFEAIEGEDMEDVEAVGLLRDASAVFHYQHGGWGTGGRALFNMNPLDAMSRLEAQYEPFDDQPLSSTTSSMESSSN